MRKYLFRNNSLILFVVLMACYACPAQTAHTVLLKWPSKGGITVVNGITVTGFKIYRATVSGGESGAALTSITDPSVIQFVDSNVTAGQTYFYKYTVTASCDPSILDCSKFVAESQMSDEASPGMIPLPAAPQLGKPASFTAILQ